MDRYLEYAQHRMQEIVDTLRCIVEMESCSADKASVDRLGHFVASMLENIGAHVTVIREKFVGDHIVADFGQGSSQILILCHLDTIWPEGTLKNQPFRIEDGIAYGPGIFDMKSGLTIALYALKCLNDLDVDPQCRIRVLFTSDEEIGAHTSREYIERYAKESDLVLCMEAPLGENGALKTARKGLGIFKLMIRGKEAHAGNDPEKGVNAIYELAHQLLKLQALNNHSLGTSVNVGVIPGGLVSNQVPSEAEAEIDVRVATKEQEKLIIKSIRSLTPVMSGASIEVKGGMNRPVMERTDAIGRTFQIAKELARNIGIDLVEASAGGGSDAQFAAAIGSPVLDGLGAVGDGMFTDREYIVLQTVPQRIALLASLLTNSV